MAEFFIYRSVDDPSQPGVHLEADRDIITGERQFRNYFDDPSTLERDLLLLAASVFCVDRGVQRGEREDFARRLEVSLPVTNIGLLQPLIPNVEQVLRLLSNDYWRIRLRQQPGEIEHPTSSVETDGQVLLFSGGLDSFAAALEFGSPGPLTLVSHVTRAQQARNAQSQLVNILAQHGLEFPHLQFFVSSRDRAGFDHDVESSQRTRSFMFLILAALVARRQGRRRLLMIAENGQMAIHLPLNPARIGAFSTHTAHPDVLAFMREILSAALSTPFLLTNPYVGRTKAEVIAPVWNNLHSAIPVSCSCWRTARLPQDITHCGECVPCLIRRIAIETHGTDPTAYGRDLFSENFPSMSTGDEARRNLSDLCEFTKRFETTTDAELLDEWPELYSSNVDASETIDMYRRAAAETRAVLARYTGLAPALL
jgi:7-cyano-7-deazaguanine synthase in queuosine biosynthesis